MQECGIFQVLKHKTSFVWTERDSQCNPVFLFPGGTISSIINSLNIYSFFASGFFFPPCWVFLRNKICLNHEWCESISKCSLAYKEDFDETKSRTTNTKSGNQSILTVLLTTTPLGLGLLSWREIFQIMAPVMTCSINCAECLRHEDHHESIFIKNSEFPNQCHRSLDSEVCSD